MRARTSPQTLSTRRNSLSHKASLLARRLVQRPGNTPPLPERADYTQHSIIFQRGLPACVSPLKRPGLLVVGFDEAHELLHEFVSRLEDSRRMTLARQDAKPDFDLVEPAGVGGSEGEVKPFLLGDPSQGFLAAVGGAMSPRRLRGACCRRWRRCGGEWQRHTFVFAPARADPPSPPPGR
jgi:hypothetical protein